METTMYAIRERDTPLEEGFIKFCLLLRQARLDLPIIAKKRNIKIQDLVIERVIIVHNCDYMNNEREEREQEEPRDIVGDMIADAIEERQRIHPGGAILREIQERNEQQENIPVEDQEYGASIRRFQSGGGTHYNYQFT